MTNLFITILNMSITASYIALTIIAARIPLKKVPKIFSYMLWLPVWIRLVMPFSFNSGFSFLSILKPDAQTTKGVIEYIPNHIGFMYKPTIDVGINGINNIVNTSLPAATPMASINPMQILLEIASIIWISGIVVLIAYSIISYIKVMRNVKTATIIEDDVFESDRIATPFVFGFIKPKIFIPVGLSENELLYILAHERTHIKRMDYLVKPLSYLVLIIHWFNPLIWISFALMSKDMEMSCDESVLKKMGNNIKDGYANTLLSFLTKRSGLLIGSPLAFGESNIKSRIKNIMAFKKPGLWIMTITIVVFAALMVAFTANPKNEQLPAPTSYSGYNVEALIANKTLYVGDNSKVVHLVDAIPLPTGIVRDMVELQTSDKPYGVTINLKMNNTSGVTARGAISGDAFYRNSILLFSLIDNADIIHCKLFDNTGEHDGAIYTFTYTREMAEKLTGEDVRTYAASTDTLKSLIDRLNNMSFDAEQTTRDETTVMEVSDSSNEDKIEKNNSDLEVERFLNSEEGYAFKAASLEFVKAYLSGDTHTMKLYLLDPKNKNNDYNMENLLNDVELLTLKLSANDIKEDEVNAQYEFGLKGKDTLQYVALIMKKIDGKWKVQFYGLEQ